MVKPIPNWVAFPDSEWRQVGPEDAGLDVAAWNDWAAERERQAGANDVAGSNTEGKHGLVITRGGSLLLEVGDGDAVFNSASVGKAFSSLALQLAVDAGIIKSVHDKVCDYWTGLEGPVEERLAAPHKMLNHGHHAAITFDHLWSMRGGFPGYFSGIWEHRPEMPDWEQWSGSANDEDYSFITDDIYAHVEPGLHYRYSSAGKWRLHQALTFILGQELKDFLDTRLFGRLGIRADGWRWIAGRTIHENAGFYPRIPAYGRFIDPPYELKGCRVQGGGGWVEMSAKDLARIGLLVATGGIWKGERLIEGTPLLRGHTGYGQSRMDGWGFHEGQDLYMSVGIVATRDTAAFKFGPEDYSTFVIGPAHTRTRP